MAKKNTFNGKKFVNQDEYTSPIQELLKSIELGNLEDVEKKLSARYKMLMVTEYYMRHFLGSLIPYSAISFCKQNLKREVYAKHILFSLEGGSNKDSVFVLAKTLKDSIDSGESLNWQTPDIIRGKE